MIAKNLKYRFYTSCALLSLLILIFKNNLILVFSLIILGVLSLLEFYNLVSKIFKNRFYLFNCNVLFTIYVFSYCFLFFYFSHFPLLKTIIFSLLLGCIASDIGGFIFGKIFKGPKLTKISPNKTISGSIGSFIFSIIIISSSIFYFTKNLSYEILTVSLAVSFACQLGDLFFSYLKRKAKIKNSGNLLPGHGGVLDRLDGIFFGVPFGFLILTFIY